MQGVFLATYTMSREIMGEDPDILVFEFDQITESAISVQAKGKSSGSHIRKKAEASINNVSVSPLLDPEKSYLTDGSTSTANCFKATFGSLPELNMVLVMILPFSVPDNICHYACQEAVISIEQFSPNSACSLRELLNQNYNNVCEQMASWDRLDSYIYSIIYQVQTMAFGYRCSQEMAFQTFMSSPVSNTAIQLPSILHVNTNYIQDLEKKAQNSLHSVQNFDSQNRASVTLNLADELLVDASEFVDVIYDDLTQINEILSLEDPSLSLEGSALFFNGFQVASNLEPVYLQPLSRTAMFHGFFEKSVVNSEEVIVDTFSMDLLDYGIPETLSANSSLCANEDYIQYFCKTEKLTDDEEAKKDVKADQGANIPNFDMPKEESEDSIQQIIKEMKIRKKKQIPVEERQRAGLKPEVIKPATLASNQASRQDERKLTNKVVSLVSKGSCLVGAVFHVMNSDNTGEFDPYFIERIKNAMNLMLERGFVAQLDEHIQQKHTFKSKLSAQQYAVANESELSSDSSARMVGEKLLTHRGGPKDTAREAGGHGRETLLTNRGQEQLAPIRQSLLSYRASAVKPPPTLRDMPAQVQDELELATINMEKLLKKDRKRRKSADAQELDSNKPISREEVFLSQEDKDMDRMKVEPLYDPLSGAHIYHIASYNLEQARIVTRNIQSGMLWFTKVQKQIYRAYAQLASAMTPNLKNKVYQSLENNPDPEDIYADVLVYLDNVLRETLVDSDGAFFQTHLPGKLKATVWEMGTMLTLPFRSEQLNTEKTNLWVVARAFSHKQLVEAAKEGDNQLNLSQSDASSDESEYEQVVVDHSTEDTEPLPEGAVRYKSTKRRSNPQITLVFMAYEKQTLINIGHLAHKYSVTNHF